MEIMQYDKRKISSIILRSGFAFVAGGKIDHIRLYEELSVCGLVPWFAIIKDNQVVIRVNAADVMEVVYAREETDENVSRSNSDDNDS